jgi:tetratricopeptide (TPR) repeat protein
MYKRIIFLVFIICFGCKAYAQDGEYIDSLFDWLKNHPKIDSAYIHNLHRISYRYSEKDVKKSYYYYQRVAAISDSLNFTFGKSLAQINIGLLLLNSGSYDASNNAFFKAIDYADACGGLRLKAVSLNNIADNFLSLRNYEKCKEYAQKAINFNQEIIQNKNDFAELQLNPYRGIAINYELLFRCYFSQKLYDEARNSLEKGVPFALKANESYIFSSYYLAFGKLRAVSNEFDSAKYYFQKAVTEAKIESDLRNEFQAYLGEAQYLTNLPFKRKLILLDSALAIAINTQYYEGISNTAEQISMAYDKEGMTDSALAYFRLYRAGFDSLFSQNTSLNLIISESAYLVKKKELENNHLLELSQLQKKQIVFRSALLLASVFLLLLTIVVAFFINKSIQAKKKKTESAFKQKIAESQIQSLRAQMNPHFIFNSLNSIENFMMQNEKRKASDYLHKFALLIRTILDSSRNEITSVSLDMEALKLYIDLEQMRFNNKFCYKENVDPQLISGDYNVPSLLIQPYVENAIVHGIAHSDKKDLTLTVSATLENNYIKYVIEDNGIGRIQAEDYNKINKLHHKSIGLKITEDRIHLFNQNENANGHITITDLYTADNTPGGTRVEVKIKVI